MSRGMWDIDPFDPDIMERDRQDRLAKAAAEYDAVYDSYVDYSYTSKDYYTTIYGRNISEFSDGGVQGRTYTRRLRVSSLRTVAGAPGASEHMMVGVQDIEGLRTNTPNPSVHVASYVMVFRPLPPRREHCHISMCKHWGFYYHAMRVYETVGNLQLQQVVTFTLVDRELFHGQEFPKIIEVDSGNDDENRSNHSWASAHTRSSLRIIADTATQAPARMASMFDRLLRLWRSRSQG